MSRAELYASQRHQQPPRSYPFSAALKAGFQGSGNNFGSRRLSAALKSQDLHADRYRVRSLMKRDALKARWKRKFVQATDGKHDLPIAANELDREFNPSQSDHAWVSDITYIRTWLGLLYLAAGLDLYSRARSQAGP